MFPQSILNNSTEKTITAFFQSCKKHSNGGMCCIKIFDAKTKIQQNKSKFSVVKSFEKRDYVHRLFKNCLEKIRGVILPIKKYFVQENKFLIFFFYEKYRASHFKLISDFVSNF